MEDYVLLSFCSPMEASVLPNFVLLACVKAAMHMDKFL